MLPCQNDGLSCQSHDMLHPAVHPRNRLMYTRPFPSLRVGSGNENNGKISSVLPPMHSPYVCIIGQSSMYDKHESTATDKCTVPYIANISFWKVSLYAIYMHLYTQMKTICVFNYFVDHANNEKYQKFPDLRSGIHCRFGIGCGIHHSHAKEGPCPTLRSEIRSLNTVVSHHHLA